LATGWPLEWTSAVQTGFGWVGAAEIKTLFSLTFNVQVSAANENSPNAFSGFNPRRSPKDNGYLGSFFGLLATWLVRKHQDEVRTAWKNHFGSRSRPGWVLVKRSAKKPARTTRR
jgi:hypothetical protein